MLFKELMDTRSSFSQDEFLAVYFADDKALLGATITATNERLQIIFDLEKDLNTNF